MFTRVSEVRRESSRARSPLGFTSVLPSAAGATLHEEREALEQLGGPARASRISCCIPLRFFAEKDQTHFLFLLFSFCARKRTSESLTRSLRAAPPLRHLGVLVFGEKGKCGVRSYAGFRSALKHLHIRKKTHCQAVQRFLECAASTRSARGFSNLFVRRMRHLLLSRNCQTALLEAARVHRRSRARRGGGDFYRRVALPTVRALVATQRAAVDFSRNISKKPATGFSFR